MMEAGRKAIIDGSVLGARSGDATGGDEAAQFITVPRIRHELSKEIKIPGRETPDLP